VDRQVAVHKAVLGALVKAGSKVVVMADTPYQKQDVPYCIASHPPGDWAACTGSRSQVLDGRTEPLVTAAQSTRGVSVVNLNDYLCTKTDCPVVIGGVIVYKDAHHLTQTYAKSLEPFLESALRGAQVL
jgi:hypothetical protein